MPLGIASLPVEPVSPAEARRFLAANRLAHLGLARGGEAYVVPVFFGYDGTHVYFHSEAGAKDDFIAATREACLAVTHARSDDEWESVLVFGPVEKVTLADEILAGMETLMRVPPPPHAGTTPRGTPRRAGADVNLWRLTPHRMTGRKSEPATDG